MALDPEPMELPNENESSPATGVVIFPYVQVELVEVMVVDPYERMQKSK